MNERLTKLPCKEIGLEVNSGLFFSGMKLVTRLGRQKELTGIANAGSNLAYTDAQFVLLGNGSALQPNVADSRYRSYGNLLCFITTPLLGAYAGTDAFLAPFAGQRGISQMLALRCGSVPRCATRRWSR